MADTLVDKVDGATGRRRWSGNCAPLLPHLMMACAPACLRPLLGKSLRPWVRRKRADGAVSGSAEGGLLRNKAHPRPLELAIFVFFPVPLGRGPMSAPGCPLRHWRQIGISGRCGGWQLITDTLLF